MYPFKLLLKQSLKNTVLLSGLVGIAGLTFSKESLAHDSSSVSLCLSYMNKYITSDDLAFRAQLEKYVADKDVKNLYALKNYISQCQTINACSFQTPGTIECAKKLAQQDFQASFAWREAGGTDFSFESSPSGDPGRSFSGSSPHFSQQVQGPSPPDRSESKKKNLYSPQQSEPTASQNSADDSPLSSEHTQSADTTGINWF